MDVVFPRSLPPWGTEWDAARGTLRLRSVAGSPSARVLVLTPVSLTAASDSAPESPSGPWGT